MKIFRKTYILMVSLLLIPMFFTSCQKEEKPLTRKVVVLYLAGYNNLYTYLEDNLKTLEENYLPGNRRDDDVVLVFEKLNSYQDNYGPQAAPVLYRLYANKKGEPVKETLKVYPEGTLAASAKTLKETLEFVQQEFPASGYGLLFSSHANGWLPPGYYNGIHTEEEQLTGYGLLGGDPEDPLESIPLYYEMPEPDPSLPMVKSEAFPLTKSIGHETIKTDDIKRHYEMSITNFAKAIPMHLDYIILDACLSGGIELAYELREKTDYLLASQTEVLADGIQYKTLTRRLFMGKQADLKAVCDDYYQCYAQKQSSIEKSATISLVNCSHLAPLQEICSRLFDKYRSSILNLEYGVQQFFRDDHHWFFDLRDILVKAGINKAELAELDAALTHCIEYEAHTDYFMNTFKIQTNCGLSMYLPSFGNDYLNEYYRNFSWNQATNLVK